MSCDRTAPAEAPFERVRQDGTGYLDRDSMGGRGFGGSEVMMSELDRLDRRYAPVVGGVVIRQRSTYRTFAGVLNPGLRIREGRTVRAADDFGGVLGATAATVGDFGRDQFGGWDLRPGIVGFGGDTTAFTANPGVTHDP
ncbi:TerD-family protein [Streptomyces fagopyri]|uniref:TerD-family protein n=1 Tax=Streptomyces fagopyri TaxID=2662397 RepID=UPI00371F4025